MNERITIIEEGRPKTERASTISRVRQLVDLQDVLIVLGFASLETGVAFIFWPAALILAGLLCWGFAYLIEKTRANEERSARREEMSGSRIA